MNKLITHKITLALFFVIICQFNLKAQDTTKKMVARSNQAANIPANNNQQYNATPPPPAVTIIPTRTAIYTPASAVISMPSKNALAHTATTTNPANTGVSTSAGVSVPVKAPSVGLAVAPAVTVKPKASTYVAPTTSERTGMPSYMTTPPKKVAVASPTTAAYNANNNVNKPVVAATTPTTTPGTGPINTNATGNATAALPVKTAIIVKPADTVAKKDTIIAKTDTTKKDTLAKDTSGLDSNIFVKQRIVFLEIGGPGLAISANYDMRVTIGQNDRFGFRAGGGYFQSGNNWVYTFPLQANYLLGKGGKYLELGLGTTFLISRGDNYSSKNFIFDDDTGFIATGTIGIRYAPNNSHINFRLAYVPIIDSDGLVNIGGFSVGYTF